MSPSRAPFWIFPLRVMLWLYPTIPVTALYGTWLIAGLVLGHMPRPSIDDPKHISLLVTVPYVLTGILLVTYPAAAIIGAAMQLSLPHHSWIQRLLSCTTNVIVWIAVVMVLRWDPLHVATWYLD